MEIGLKAKKGIRHLKRMLDYMGEYYFMDDSGTADSFS